MIPGSRIDGQNQAYRRGLVMGLTMAEVGILIIFVLLLLVAWSAVRHQREAASRAGMQRIPVTELEALRRSGESLQEVTEALGLQSDAPPDEIVELARRVQRAASAAGGVTALAEASEAMQDLQQELATKDGQLRYLQDRLDAAGGGGGERPCWVEADGTVRFLFDVLLTSSGIRMRARPGVEAVATRFPVPAVRPDVVLAEQQFLDLTRPLYDYGRSDERQCRFHVWIYDGTGVQEKDLYKRLVRTVEAHFYRQYRVSDVTAFQ